MRDAVYRNVIGECKTEASKKPVPLHPLVIAELQAWREVAPYNGDDDFVFASTLRDGKTPIAPDMMLKKRIRPALKRAGIVGKVIGWHSFRHGLGTMLNEHGVDVKDGPGNPPSCQFAYHAGHLSTGYFEGKTGGTEQVDARTRRRKEKGCLGSNPKAPSFTAESKGPV